MSKHYDFVREQYNGSVVLCPETEEAEAWIDQQADLTPVWGGILADEELIQSILESNLTIEG